MASKSKRAIVKEALLTSTCEDDLYTLEQLEQYKHPRFHEYSVGLSGYGCGCYYSCDCSRVRFVMYGHRWETDEEMAKRLAKEQKEAEELEARRREQELATLRNLLKKYPGEKV
jgi:hypothetical protein